MPTYNPAKVSIAITGINTPVQRGEATFIKAARNADKVGLKMGSDGKGARFINPDNSGTIELTLLASSPTNNDLEDLAQQDEDTNDGVVSINIEDLTGTAVAHAANAWVKKKPDLTREKEIPDVTWIFETDDLELTQGGTNDDGE